MEAPSSFESSLPLVGKSEYSFLSEFDSIFDKYRKGQAPSNAPFKLFESNCSTSGDEDSEDSLEALRKARGPYRKYTFDEKLKAVDRVLSGQDIKLISKEFGIPRRNLLRWKKNGCQRKEGGGRPTDSEMEKIIYEKIKCEELRTEKQIRNFAINHSKMISFKASKGWFVKFCNRFHLDLSNGAKKKAESNEIAVRLSN